VDLLAVGKEPISAEQPSGTDVRCDPLFDLLQAEVGRTSIPSVRGEVDWETVVRIASDILSRKSKDLLVAGYLGVGLIHTRRMDGLHMALKIYRDLIEYHGSALFPERQRGRLRSVEWWLEKTEAAVNLLDCSVQPSQLAVMQENLEKLEQLLGELLPEAPSLQVLRCVLLRLAQLEPTGEAASSSVSVKDGSVPAGAVSDGSAPDVSVPEGSRSEGATCEGSVSEVAPGDEASGTTAMATPAAAEGIRNERSDCRQKVEESLNKLRDTAMLLRDQSLADPAPYRFFRQALWLSVADLPPASAGRTMLAPPGKELRVQLAGLRRIGDSAELLKIVERQLSQFIFWLDLNRLTAEALVDLGNAQAALAVKQETAHLLQRLPGLEELAFADGTSFADADTRRWLESLVGTGSAGACPPEFGHPSEIACPIEIGEEIDAALIDQGRLIEAVARFQKLIRNSNSGREQLQRRIALSQLLLATASERFAIPVLEQVVRDIDNHWLEAYDPLLALEGLRLAWKVFASRSEPEFKEKAGDLLHRIARLDLAEMVRLDQGEL
jgi:type VI secretion system protein VasJ